MTPIEEMTDEQFELYTLSVLEKELGPLGMARYLRLHGQGTSDYTRDRHQWLDRISLDELLAEARKIELPATK